MRDVKDAAHPRGTTITIRDLFFNVPARRKFLRSEATETFHLTNLITHYALAHPEIAFTFTNNGREVIRATAAKDLRERAYQIFGEEFLDNLLEVNGGHVPDHLVKLLVSLFPPLWRNSRAQTCIQCGIASRHLPAIRSRCDGLDRAAALYL